MTLVSTKKQEHNKYNLWNNYVECLKNYFNFSDRATRYNFWGFILMDILFTLLTVFIPVLGILYALFTIIPRLAVVVRRLHDVNKSGWYLILPFGIVICGIAFAALAAFVSRIVASVLLILSCLVSTGCHIYIIYLLTKKSDDNKNRFGPVVVESDKKSASGKRLMIGIIIFAAVMHLIAVIAVIAAIGYSKAIMQLKTSQIVELNNQQ